jgi:hypothetical protein
VTGGQLQQLGVALLGQPLGQRLGWAVFAQPDRAEHQDRALADPNSEVVDHLQALGIGPLEVVEADHDPAAPPATVWPGQAQQQLEHAFGGQQPALVSREVGVPGGLWPLGQDRRQPWRIGIQLRGKRERTPQRRTQGLRDQTVGRRCQHTGCPARQHREPAGSGLLEQLGGQASLARARLANHEPA